MLVPIQRMTEAEALANLSPYSDNNKNSTSWMFLDVDDNDTLKGLFYNDAEPNEKEVRPLSKQAGLTYSSYTAIISQAGAAAPTVDSELENTLGAPIFTRNGVGDYNLEIIGAFILDKTTGFIVNPTATSLGTNVKRIDDDNIQILTQIGATLTATDGALTLSTIEIRVYS